MKKFAVIAVCLILLMVSCAFAQVSRNPNYISEGKSVFTNLAVVGLDVNGTNTTAVPGQPAYIEMTDGSGAGVWYLWVDYSGVLRISSPIAVGFGASPSLVQWYKTSGTVVGVQSAP